LFLFGIFLYVLYTSSLVTEEKVCCWFAKESQAEAISMKAKVEEENHQKRRRIL
jgi:hypothetical protein